MDTSDPRGAGRSRGSLTTVRLVGRAFLRILTQADFAATFAVLQKEIQFVRSATLVTRRLGPFHLGDTMNPFLVGLIILTCGTFTLGQKAHTRATGQFASQK